MQSILYLFSSRGRRHEQQLHESPKDAFRTCLADTDTAKANTTVTLVSQSIIAANLHSA